MNTDYTIFIDNYAIFICNSKSDNANKNSVLIENAESMTCFLDAYFQEQQTSDILMHGYPVSKMFGDFNKYFKYIEAAGGLVRNEKKEYLFIKRFGIWDLPKGKIEGEEKIDEGAIREVEEETGIIAPEIKDALNPTFHTYEHKGAFVLKKTYWYLMEVHGHQDLRPQFEEDITEVLWLNVDESKKALADSYRSLNDSLSKYICE